MFLYAQEDWPHTESIPCETPLALDMLHQYLAKLFHPLEILL